MPHPPPSLQERGKLSNFQHILLIEEEKNTFTPQLHLHKKVILSTLRFDARCDLSSHMKNNIQVTAVQWNLLGNTCVMKHEMFDNSGELLK